MASGTINNLVKSSTKTANGVTATRKGDTITISIKAEANVTTAWTTLTTLDETYRPSDFIQTFACNYNDTSKMLALQILATGEVQVSCTVAMSSARIKGLYTYLV